MAQGRRPGLSDAHQPHFARGHGEPAAALQISRCCNRDHFRMNVSLTPELEELVSAKVQSGRYNSASEVVREALRLLEEHDSARAAQLAEFNGGPRPPPRPPGSGGGGCPARGPRPIAAQVRAAREAPRVSGYVL